jgi:hypothetical protein
MARMMSRSRKLGQRDRYEWVVEQVSHTRPGGTIELELNSAAEQLPASKNGSEAVLKFVHRGSQHTSQPIAGRYRLSALAIIARSDF